MIILNGTQKYLVKNYFLIFTCVMLRPIAFHVIQNYDRHVKEN